MKGNIYTEQKCSLCGTTMRHEERRSGCYCPDHSDQVAKGQYYVKFGRQIKRRFPHYIEASRFLTGIRFKANEGTLDPRDYQADNPMGLDNLAYSYLEEKKHLKSFRDVDRFMMAAIRHWEGRNVKAIQQHDIKKFLFSIEASNKTRHNYRSTLHDFFTRYLVEEGVLTRVQVPEFPRVDYELGWRSLTDWENQQKIMDEILRISWDVNPKVYLSIDLLRTYTSLRPGDILKITESDIDLNTGVLTIRQPTKKKSTRKMIRLLDEHLEQLAWIREKYTAMPHVPWGRHHGGVKESAAGQPWGEKYLYKWWVKACRNLGIENLDLYGGTRHTTITELAKVEGEHAAREATGHETNKAFERYCRIEGERAHQMAKVVKRHHGDPDHRRTTLVDLSDSLSSRKTKE